MKRFLAIILAGLMLLTLVACGGKDDVRKRGVLQAEGMNKIRSSEHNAHRITENKYDIEDVNYSNLSAALMDLESGKINFLSIEKCTADYVATHNDKFTVVDANDRKVDYSMMIMDSNTEVYNILDDAIKAMKEDGTLDSLIENELKAYIESDPEAKDLPHFEGAKTIKVGVTGDVPPMDFVASNGKAAGFNIALLAEIANRAKVNIELVQIETGARAMALSSGKVDAVFWAKSTVCTVCNTTATEKIDGTLLTESYFSDYSARLLLKSEK
jgi:ABC-type amino acid transport substrate-binding protein